MIIMSKTTKVATSNASVNINAANAASVESINNSIMEERTTSKEESVRYYTRDELGRLGKDLEIKPTAVKASINGKTQTIKYKQSSTPNDASGGALETVSQMTKFKVDSFTYYMSVDSIRIVGEDTNQLAELIGQMF